MSYWNLSSETQRKLTNLPETGMGFQIVDARVFGQRRTLLVIGNGLALDPAAGGVEFSMNPSAVFENGVKMMGALNDPERLRQFSSPEPSDFRILQTRIPDPSGFAQTPQSQASPPLVTPSSLIKRVVLPSNRIFHRFSAFNPDRRVDPTTGDFLPGTYATPESEVPFLPTGFAVVGRLALPNNLPASHHYTIEVSAGTVVYFGTVAPAFGQAGGGVEAFFPNGAKNCAKPPAVPNVIPDE